MYLTQGLHRAVQQQPDAVATICGDRTRTFAEQAERVSRLAGALQWLGVAEGDRVAYLGLNSDRFVEHYLAVWWAGAVVNPVNVRWAAEEIGYSLEDSETAVLIVDDVFAPAVPAILGRYPGVRSVVHAGDGPTPEGLLSYEQLVTDGPAVEDVRRGADALAGLWYTGGTTGFPKGVMLSHANLLTSAMGGQAAGLFSGAGSRFLHVAPMFHLADLAGLIGTLISGGTHVIVPMFDPVAVMDACERHRVTETVLIPIMIQMLVDHPELASRDLSSLRTMLYGGSPIPLAVLDRARKALPGVGFVQAYGQTELSPLATLLGAAEHEDADRPDRLRSGGRAAPCTEVRIADAEDREVPRGEMGEILVRGGNVMLGYWRRPEETAAALRGGWMHTGDLGRMDADGYVYVLDRLKDMIITGGENVYSTEVENAVASHPAVANCAVIGVPDERWGERVHAVVVLQPGAAATEGEIREHAKASIAGYKAPRTVEFVDALPVTPTGKVLKRELRARYWEGAERAVN
jgi:acyl-CoA synthetase (AMP-forming)/AMP-acid ligase II